MRRMFFAGAVTLVIATSCSQPTADREVVKQTYVHKYGVTVSQRDWEQRGRDGQVVATHKNGVIETKNFRNGVLEGNSTYTFPHSQTIQRIMVYRQGDLVKEVMNYPSGLPMQEDEYTTPSTKISTLWYEAGTPQSVEEYEEGLLVKGEYLTPANDRESEVLDGEGTRLRRDAYGQVLSSDTIKSGVMMSRMLYHANGMPKAIIPYVNGLVEGKKRTYLPGGEPSSIEEWVTGEQHGVTTVFQNGERIAEVTYRHGHKNGLERHFRNGNILEQEITWIDDQKHGPCSAYIDGSVRTDWYLQGKLVSKVAFEQMN